MTNAQVPTTGGMKQHDTHNDTGKWYLLPGMGANSLMYAALRPELQFEMNFLDWPVYKGEKTYPETAKRVIEENGIKDGDVVGGSSLGGMIAAEIGRKRRLTAVVLIGSAIHPTEVQGLLSFLSPLASITPISLIQLLAGKHAHIASTMFAEADPEFIRAMCRYLTAWRGAGSPERPFFRIHGQKDHVIPCPKTGCETLADAGHLLAITHPKECGRYLNKLYRRLTEGLA